ncbi:MAG: hypothetical protein RXR20_19655 [Paraburkholderia sp.]|jgi:hypothetical protein|uniref:hypothetical protein n=1 Tax=Burkholderiaceae TaxID=119060 RepID=UPI0010F56E72|nr:hypothetical protein [Burkholderia sp. 4M9327F10]
MQLLALDGCERYHTLASLVESGAEELSANLFMGFDPTDNHVRVSRVLHEITHVASFRTTRLGFWIARIATPLFRTQIGEATPDIPDSVQTLLGMFAPLLEGLAIYGQLDYDADNTEAVLPFPLNKITTNNAAASFHGGPLAALRGAKLMAVSDGLLTELFVRKIGETAHYFIGYLYVKAVAAHIARFAPELGAPSTLLPLLIRLICDHPAIERAVDGKLKAEDILGAVHSSLRGLTCAHVEMLDRMLRNEWLRANFDNWDIHAQLQAGETAQFILHSESNPLFPHNDHHDDLDNAQETLSTYVVLRASTSVHLTSWTSGTLIEAVDEGTHVRFRLAGGVGDRPTRDVKLILYSRVETVCKGLGEDAFAKLEALDESVLEHARQAAAGSRITVGNYLTLTKGIHGTALWVDGKIKNVIPFSLLENQVDIEEFDITTTGLMLSPDYRLAVARSLRVSDVQNAARGYANEFLLEALVSNPEHQLVARSGRLNPFLTSASRAALADWCAHPYFHLDGRLDADVVDRLTEIFDRPHFGGGSFNELLPDLTTITALRPGATNVAK